MSEIIGKVCEDSSTLNEQEIEMMKIDHATRRFAMEVCKGKRTQHLMNQMIV